MVLDDCITWYNNNHKGFLFISVLKPMILKSVVELIKEEAIDWEVFIIIVNLSQKKHLLYWKGRKSKEKNQIN